MEQKVEQQSEARDLSERVEEMLSAIDAACEALAEHVQAEGQDSIDDLAELTSVLIGDDGVVEVEDAEVQSPGLSDGANESGQAESPDALADESSAGAGEELRSEQEGIAEAADGLLTAEDAQAEESSTGEPEQAGHVTDQVGELAEELSASIRDVESLSAQVEEIADKMEVGQEPSNVTVEDAEQQPESECEPEASAAHAGDEVEALSTAIEDADALAGEAEEVAGEIEESEAVDSGEAPEPIEQSGPEPAEPEQAAEGEPVAQDESTAEDEPIAEDESSAEQALAEAVAETSVQAEEAPSIEELDSELASLADAMVEGTFEDADGEETGQVVAAEAPEENSPPEPVAEEDDAEAVEQPVGVAAAPVHEPRQRESAVAAAFSRVRSTAVPLTHKAWMGTRPLLAQGLLLVNKPIEKLSPSTRDTIGWFAVYTAFLAVCVWGFLLLFRKPIAPEPTVDPIGLLNESTPGTPDS